MRILFYSRYFLPKTFGGLENYLYRLMVKLRDQHHIVFLTPKANNIMIKGVEVYILHSSSSRFFNTISQLISTIITLPIILRKEKIDLISLFVPSILTALMLGISKFIGVKTSINIRGLKPEKILFKRISRDLCLIFTNNILINSKDFKERFISQSFLPKSILNSKNWIYIPNGISTDFWSRKDPEPQKLYDISFVTRIETKEQIRTKGFDILYKAIEKVYQEYGKKLKVIVVGPYNKIAIQKIIPEIDFSYFNFKGLLKSVEDIKTCLITSKIFILSSRHEGMPNSLLEAMASGVASIASNVGSVPDLIINNKNGLTFPNEDYCKLAEYILKLLNNSELCQNFGIAGQKKILEEFSWEKIISKLENFYEKLIQFT